VFEASLDEEHESPDLDRRTFDAELDKRSTPDDTEGQFKMQAYTRRQSLPNPAPSSPSFLRSRQPTTVKVSTLDPPLPSSDLHLPGFRSMSSPIFRLKDLAYTKLIIHALKYPRESVNGLLLGQLEASNAPIDIVDAVPLQHHRTKLSPGYISETEVHTMDVGLRMVRSSPRLLPSVTLNRVYIFGARYTTTYTDSCQLHVVGFYEVPESFGDRTLSKVGELVAAKIKESDFPTPVVLVVSLQRLLVSLSSLIISDVFNSSTAPC
jgi:hypothetical protein